MNRRKFFQTTGGALAVASIAGFASVDVKPQFEPGTLAFDKAGNRYRYLRAPKDQQVGDCAKLNDYEVAVAMAALKSGEYGWCQIV